MESWTDYFLAALWAAAMGALFAGFPFYDLMR